MGNPQLSIPKRYAVHRLVDGESTLYIRRFKV